MNYNLHINCSVWLVRAKFSDAPHWYIVPRNEYIDVETMLIWEGEAIGMRRPDK